jgi:hypothetical protein
MPLLVRMNKRGRAAFVSSTTEPYQERSIWLVPQVVFMVKPLVVRESVLVETAPRVFGRKRFKGEDE